MSQTQPIEVSKLHLDLKNYRTTPQADETHAAHALVSVNPEWFWKLLESLLDDGFHANENIIVMRVGRRMVVQEGNRRIASIKFILGLIPMPPDIPRSIQNKIEGVDKGRKATLRSVPCAVFQEAEADAVAKLVSLTHGKAEQAGRLPWDSIARARYQRDKEGKESPALVLVEKYLANGRNLSAQESEAWAGSYPITVLEEAIRKYAGTFGAPDPTTLAEAYPDGVNDRSSLERFIHEVGKGNISFKKIRLETADLAKQGWVIPSQAAVASPASVEHGTASAGTQSVAPTAGGVPTGGNQPSRPEPEPARSKTKALPEHDPKSVRRLLNRWDPRGPGREKLAALLREARGLKVDEKPYAFCFVLRAMFELSAKAYCDDSKGVLKTNKADGTEKPLIQLLREVTEHMLRSPNPADTKPDKETKKRLHGALTCLGDEKGLLSVESMNQLMHNRKFSAEPAAVCRLFHSIFPLLEDMNR